MTPRVVVVATSSRTPPGLLSWPAWEALRSGRVHVVEGSPQLAALRGAGVEPVSYATDLPVGDLVALLLAAPGPAVWLADEDGADVVRAIGQRLRAGATGAPAPVLEVLHGSWDAPGARLLDVVAVMDRLRSPGGCPWDARQTHVSLAPYLLEESYELLEAIEEDDRGSLREELGDVLLQVAFHARLAEEHDEPWSIDDVARDLVDKLVRRHPHVFAGGSADDLEGSWDALKAAEKGRTSVTEGVPLAQPALSLAAKLQKRAERLGAVLPSYDGRAGELWSLVVRCRAEGLDPEAELRALSRAFRDRLAETERGLLAEGRAAQSMSDADWRAALGG